MMSIEQKKKMNEELNRYFIKDLSRIIIDYTIQEKYTKKQFSKDLQKLSNIINIFLKND